MATRTPLTWSVVIPVKVLAHAKSRLAGLAAADRQALALAMAADTVVAATACPAVGAVVVVSSDQAVAWQLHALGAEVIPDEPGAGLNLALAAGAEHAVSRWPEQGLAALTADLPALSAQELGDALLAAADAPNSFVPDAAGSGTTLYTARPGASFLPRFGPASRERHRASGAVEIRLAETTGLRQDVDTASDLRRAAKIGLGMHSAAIEATLANAD